MTLRETCGELARHPVKHVIFGWHWKNAVMSAVTHRLLFFVANLAAGPGRASRAAIVEFALRMPLVGLLAAVTQLFRLAEPAWAAAAVTVTVLPLAAHIAELATHVAAGTPQLRTSLIASIAMSAVATAFNLFAMRRGTLIVGDGARSLADDLSSLPRLIGAFVRLPIDAATTSWRRRKPVAALSRASTLR